MTYHLSKQILCFFPFRIYHSNPLESVSLAFHANVLLTYRRDRQTSATSHRRPLRFVLIGGCCSFSPLVPFLTSWSQTRFKPGNDLLALDEGFLRSKGAAIATLMALGDASTAKVWYIREHNIRRRVTPPPSNSWIKNHMNL